MSRIHIFTHVSFEGPGLIATWAEEQKHELSYTFWHENDPLPDMSRVDWLVIMGGPMSVNDTHVFPWLIREKEFIREAIDEGKIVLGICLGAQLIADVLGVKVKPNTEKEIGWHEIQLSPEVHNLKAFQTVPEKMTVFHWHGETFALPPKSLPLFSSEATPVQGFIHNDRVIGLQFHPELTPENLDLMIQYCGEDLRGGGKYVQSEAQIREGFSNYHTNGQEFLYHLLGLLHLARTGPPTTASSKAEKAKMNSKDLFIRLAIIVPIMVFLQIKTNYLKMGFGKQLLIVTAVFAFAHLVLWLIKSGNKDKAE